MSTATDIEEIDVMLKYIEATMEVIRTVLERIKERNEADILDRIEEKEAYER